jgi:predicted dehydrogenase
VPQRRRGEELLPTTAPDTDAFIAQYANGCQGIFHISWTAPGDRLMRHELAGSEGMVALSLYHDEWDSHLATCRAGEDRLRPVTVPDDIQRSIPRTVGTEAERLAAHEVFLFGYPSLVRAFLDSIANDTAPAPSFADGHATQQVMDAVVRSDLERRWVEVGKE